MSLFQLSLSPLPVFEWYASYTACWICFKFQNVFATCTGYNRCKTVLWNSSLRALSQQCIDNDNTIENNTKLDKKHTSIIWQDKENGPCLHPFSVSCFQLIDGELWTLEIHLMVFWVERVLILWAAYCLTEPQTESLILPPPEFRSVENMILSLIYFLAVSVFEVRLQFAQNQKQAVFDLDRRWQGQ